MTRHFRFLILLFLLPLSVVGCAEIELASHVAKQVPIPDNNKSQGYFKVGSPYKIAGKTYKPAERYNYEQTGIASWYGPNFHGKQTANGETFDMYELTAAHKTLQMPSLVRVTNLENGRSIVVRINDRGPFSKGRIVDLSKRGAELLGFENQGTAKVKLQVLSNESRKIAENAKQGIDTRKTEIAMNEHRYQPIPHAPVRPQQRRVAQNAAIAPVKQAPLSPQSVEPNNIYVQAGSFGDALNAEKLASALSNVGNVQVLPTSVDGQNYFRVRIGPLADVPQADNVMSRLASIGQNNAIVVVD